MRLHEILTEGYSEELIDVIQDILVGMMTADIKKISTEDFRNKLAQEGYIVSIDELIQAVSKSGFASSVDKNEIVPADQLGDMDTAPEATVDVGDMAGDQAMSDINSELPQ